MDTVTAVVSLAILAEAIVAIVAVGYIVSVYIRRQADSRFFRMLLEVDILTVIGGAFIAAIIAGRFVELTLPAPWGTIVVGLAIAAMLFAPIQHAWVLAEIRRSRGDRTPPPLRDGD